jgi:hypothetical protein
MHVVRQLTGLMNLDFKVGFNNEKGAAWMDFFLVTEVKFLGVF